MFTLEQYKILTIEEKMQILERIELLIDYTERASERYEEVFLFQLDRLHHYYNLGWAFL